MAISALRCNVFRRKRYRGHAEAGSWRLGLCDSSIGDCDFRKKITSAPLIFIVEAVGAVMVSG
jgi:hypothetical protein